MKNRTKRRLFIGLSYLGFVAVILIVLWLTNQGGPLAP